MLLVLQAAFPSPVLVQSVSLGGAVKVARFSPDGRTVASLEADGGTFQIREVATGKLLVSARTGGRVRSANYDPIRQVLTSIRADYGPGGQENRSLVTATATDHWIAVSRRFTAANLVQDRSGSFLLLPSKNQGTLLLPAAHLDAALSWPFEVRAFGVDRSGKWAAVCTDQGTKIVSMPDGKAVQTPSWEKGDGTLLLEVRSKRVASLDADGVNVWDYGSGREKYYEFFTDASGPAVISPGGKYLFYGTLHSGATLIDLDDGHRVVLGDSGEITSPTADVDISDDGQELAVGFGSGVLRVWRTRQSLCRP